MILHYVIQRRSACASRSHLDQMTITIHNANDANEHSNTNDSNANNTNDTDANNTNNNSNTNN